MPAGPIGTCWDTDSWDDTAWDVDSWEGSAVVGAGDTQDLTTAIHVFLNDFYSVNYEDTQHLIGIYLEEEFTDEDYSVRWDTLEANAKAFY